MKFTGISLRALLLGAAIATVAGLVPGTPALAQAKQTNSPKLAAPLKAANDDIKAKKYSDAIAKLKEAEGIAGKTPYDQHLINDMLGFAYAKTNNYPEAAKAWEAEIDDGFTAQAEIAQKTRALAELNYQLKNYDKAIEYGNRAIKGGFADETMRQIVGQSYYLKGDWKNTLKFEEGIADAQIKAGETPKSETLQLILSACVKLNDNACTTKALERLVTYYPKGDYWYQLLFALRQQASGKDADTLQVYRLMFDVDVLKNGDDYSEMAQLCMDVGSPGEARTVLTRAFEKNAFTEQRVKERNQRLLDKAKQASTSDQAQLPKLEQEANASATGAKNVGVGIAYYGYGQYDKASDQLQKGLTKGGLKDEASARLLLGISQLKGGHKDDAIKTFHAVKGDATQERLGSLWALHAKQA